jgi:hypothetical protein
MSFYRKKPVVIEAYKLTVPNIEFVANWCNGSIKGIALPEEEQVIDIQTLEGEMRAEIGDYVIKGVMGEFYPCKPEIFEITYEYVG